VLEEHMQETMVIKSRGKRPPVSSMNPIALVLMISREHTLQRVGCTPTVQYSRPAIPNMNMKEGKASQTKLKATSSKSSTTGKLASVLRIGLSCPPQFHFRKLEKAGEDVYHLCQPIPMPPLTPATILLSPAMTT
jgi:dihydroorotate dehydrogenase